MTTITMTTANYLNNDMTTANYLNNDNDYCKIFK